MRLQELAQWSEEARTLARVTARNSTNILAGRKAESGLPPRWRRVSRASSWLLALSLVRAGEDR